VRSRSEALRKLSRDPNAREVVTFLFVGGLNTAFAYCVYALSYLAGASPTMALIFATLAGMVFNFFTTGRLVFGSKRLAAFPKFVLSSAVMFCANYGGLHGLLALGSHPLLALALVLCVTVPTNFLVSKFLVFRDRGTAAQKPLTSAT